MEWFPNEILVRIFGFLHPEYTILYTPVLRMVCKRWCRMLKPTNEEIEDAWRRSSARVNGIWGSDDQCGIHCDTRTFFRFHVDQGHVEILRLFLYDRRPLSDRTEKWFETRAADVHVHSVEMARFLEEELILPRTKLLSCEGHGERRSY